MSYRVKITDTALAEVEEAYLWLRERAPSQAVKWRKELLEAAESLKNNPERCALAPENEGFISYKLRHLIYGNYRIVFTITGETVYILHVRHCARRLVIP